MILDIKPNYKKAMWLLHNGAKALSIAQTRGMKIDVLYLQKSQKEIDEKLKYIKDKILNCEEGKEWYRKYKTSLNFDSNIHVSYLLFDILKLPVTKRTPSGAPAVDAEVLKSADYEIVSDLLQYRKLCKLKNTYIRNLIEETVDGILHPEFNLHTVKTYRSSSESPNFQNLPIRDPEMGAYVRKAFIPRKDFRIVEADYGALEVRIAACYHEDPLLVKYIKTNHDFHKDYACACYKLKPEEVNKKSRYSAKNGFVFPEFYGSYFEQVAPELWKNIKRLELKNELTGEDLYTHLRKKGIRNQAQFTEHIKCVEEKFWNEDFTTYNEWRIRWYNNYLERGWFNTLTGFHIEGVFRKNEVINYPVQGSAFHCLLYSFIEITKELRKRRMKSGLIGQIHDSIVAEVHKDEFEEFVKICKYITEEKVRIFYTWISVSLLMELEASPLNSSWYEKQEIKI